MIYYIVYIIIFVYHFVYHFVSPLCDDEQFFNCSTCIGGCPATCREFTECFESTTTHTDTQTVAQNFTCDDGCQVESIFENDGWCDCSNCEGL